MTAPRIGLNDDGSLDELVSLEALARNPLRRMLEAAINRRAT